MKACFDITGMNCASCSAAVERAVKNLGIDDVSVNLLSGVLTVDYDGSKQSEADIFNAVKKAGFGIERAKSAAEKRQSLRLQAQHEQKSLFLRLISSVFIMTVLMYVSMGHMYGLPTPVFLRNPVTLGFTQLFLTLPILIINYRYFTNGTKHLFSGNPNMDSLICVGSFAAFAYGIFAIIKIISGDHHYVHDLYFETSAMIPTLVTVGKYLEGRSRAGTSKALDLLIDLTPKKALVIRDGREQEIDAPLLEKGDTVIVKPGEIFPCDGIIISGESYVDQSSLTGESIPEYKTIHDNVNAGTLNKNGTLTISATNVGDETVISGIIKLVENASGSKAPISRLADRISAVFVPIVIGISVITFILWLIFTGDFEFSFSRAICVLVISCPCSLGLATPLAVTVGTGVAASNGILIKNAAILELMGKTNTILFDKTGTLTNGTPIVTDIIPSGSISETDLLRLCASIESLSEHPLGQAIVTHAESMGISLLATTSYRAIPGKGLLASIENENYIGGNLELLNEQNISIPASVHDSFSILSKQGKTPLFFARGSEYIGCIAVRDQCKPGSKKAITALKDMGIDSVMTTGDNPITANEIAKELGIQKVCASVTPENKEEMVRHYKAKGFVAMCGDGINDSPALASADIGISLSKGTDIAIEAADVILINNDIYSIPRAIALSRAALTNIKLSLFWALLYNTLGIPIAAGLFYPIWGITLSPMIGAAAMSLSSICVVLNALRLRYFKFD